MTKQTPFSALAGILDTVGFDTVPADHVTFSGADPILPSNFLIGTAGAASIAACGLAAADLWELDRHVEVAMDALRVPPEDADVTTLSGGERRRVALARLLLSKPEMLLLLIGFVLIGLCLGNILGAPPA